MAWIDWESVLSMHVKLLSKLTKLRGKLWNQSALSQDKKRANKIFEACGKKKKPASRKKPQSACALYIRVYGRPVYTSPKNTGTSGWSTFEIVFEQLGIALRITPDSVHFNRFRLQGARKAYPELRHPDIRIYPDTCKRSLTERAMRLYLWPIYFPLIRSVIACTCGARHIDFVVNASHLRSGKRRSILWPKQITQIASRTVDQYSGLNCAFSLLFVLKNTTNRQVKI